jgi:hypothetical protein
MKIITPWEYPSTKKSLPQPVVAASVATETATCGSENSRHNLRQHDPWGDAFFHLHSHLRVLISNCVALMRLVL